ncbi:two-component system sensor histidine kinase NtrB [Desulfitobacterium sp.]|uniref:two-component system sensor histidine kinase NtrB n=1 Tax=Desulfitobacterium sp. TaxID=49981 RepID=UPI002CBE9233|nr:ATP-binding protein [Desulfitobacterium sp.]HVJ49497.1 ATP-binding protein [Desulfitobacterium sp.]
MKVLLHQNPPLIQTVDYSRAPLLVLDRDHLIIDASPEVQKLLKLSESSLLNRSIFSVLPLPEAELKVWESFKGEITYYSKDQETIYLNYFIHPILDRGQRTGRLITFSDVSEEKKRDEAYLQAAKYSVVRQVGAGLAHELRNPLTTIKGFMQLIGPNQFPEKLRPYHQLILDEIKTTDELIHNFLLLTNPSAPQFKTVEPEDLIRNVMQILQPSLLINGLTIQLSIVNPIVPILGDEEQLLQALLSIIQNAIDASPVESEIRITLSGQENVLELSVEDQGKGIPKNMRDRVFDPFFTTRKDGSGLGLTIAKRIILAHHGELKFMDPPQAKGTFILLRLPAHNIKECKIA